MERKIFLLIFMVSISIVAYSQNTSKENVLDEVVVTGEKGKIVSTHTSSYIVDSEQLNYTPSFMGEKDVLKYFQILPGVNSGKEGSSGINLRGGSTDQTLVLLDDVPIYNTAHAFGFISLFSGEYINSAQLYKGFIPAQYGGRLSGVATMSIKEGNRDEHEQSLQLGTTTFSATAEGPINGGKGSYLIGGRYFIPSLFLQGASLILKERDVARLTLGFYDLTAKLSYDVSKNSILYASFYSGRDAFNMDMNMKLSYEELEQSSKYRMNWGNIASSIRFNSRLSSKSLLNITAYYSSLSNNRVNGYGDSNGTNVESKIHSDLEEVGVKFNIKHNVTDWYNFTYGLNSIYQYFSPLDLSITRNQLQTNEEHSAKELFTNNLYLDNNFRFANFDINMGARASMYSNKSENFLAIEPRLSVTYYVNKGAIWVSYTQNTQPLFSVSQTTSNFPMDYWLPFKDKDEMPISKQISIGYKQSITSALDIQLESYYKKSNNLTYVYELTDYLLDDGGYHIGSGDAYGVELLAQYKRNRLNTMLSYAYSKSLCNINGKVVDFIYDTPHNLNIYGSYQTLKREERNHTLGVNINYKSGVPYTLSTGLYPMSEPFANWCNDLNNYPNYANARLTNFFRVDLSYTMEKRLKRGSRAWQFSILNATAHNNPYLVYVKPVTVHNNKSGGYDVVNELKGVTIIPFLPSFSYIRRF